MRRLSGIDARFLDLDAPETPRHVASLSILEPGETPLDYERLLQAISDRIDIVHRYRQKVVHVPGAINFPVWVDDEDFDLSFHVRRSALPAPGSMDSLLELVSRLIARRLDHDQPLWELYLIEGLRGGRSALLVKSHQALVDGSETIDLAQVLLEETPYEKTIPEDVWTPRPQPSRRQLVLDSVAYTVKNPLHAIDLASEAFDKVTSMIPVVRRSVPQSPLLGNPSRYRRIATATTKLSDYRLVRDQHGGTVNDVILATISGALRSWMMTRGDESKVQSNIRAMVPMSVTDSEGLPTSLGSKVVGRLMNLPVSESNPVVRLHQVSYALKEHHEAGSATSANKLASLPGFATSTFHAVGARVAEINPNLKYHILITNVPGPQDPVYVAGQQVQQVYPCLPLGDDRVLSIGVTSYEGKVYFGIVANREEVPDVELLSQLIVESLEELVDTVKSPRQRAPRGRQKPSRN